MQRKNSQEPIHIFLFIFWNLVPFHLHWMAFSWWRLCYGHLIEWLIGQQWLRVYMCVFFFSFYYCLFDDKQHVSNIYSMWWFVQWLDWQEDDRMHTREQMHSLQVHVKINILLSCACMSRMLFFFHKYLHANGKSSVCFGCNSSSNHKIRRSFFSSFSFSFIQTIYRKLKPL